MASMDFNVSRRWVYSGIFQGWWCYNDQHNSKINKMYKDYCQRNNINFTDVICKKIKQLKIKNQNLQNQNLQNQNLQNQNLQNQNLQNQNLQNQNLQNQTNKNSDELFDLVDFDDIEDSPVHEEIVVDYIVRVADESFRIDLGIMKQINVNDPKKQRNIHYIDLPDDLLGNENKIIEHLKSHGVKGISGKAW
jgi:hypothetical protein